MSLFRYFLSTILLKLWAFIKVKKQFFLHVTVRKIKKNSLYKVIARILPLGFSVVAHALGNQAGKAL